MEAALRSRAASLDPTSFLWFGYSVRNVRAQSSVVDVSQLRCDAQPVTASLQQRVELGVARLNAALDRAFQRIDGDLLIPLSGGIDSRGLLAGAVARLETKRITAFTYGFPGSMDYELAAVVAKRAGVRHVAFNLNTHRYDLEALIDVSRRVESRTSLFDYRPARWIESELGINRLLLSGFSASHDYNPVAGVNPAWARVVATFLRDYRASGAANLTPPGVDISSALPRTPLLPAKRMPLDIQFNLFVRQEFGCRFTNLKDRYVYLMPLVDPDWFSFMISSPLRLRRRRFLYRAILRRLSPSLFAIPTKSYYGLPLSAPHWRVMMARIATKTTEQVRAMLPAAPVGLNRRVNYADFDHALRERADIRDVVRGALADLKRRGVVDWVDADQLWRHHERRHANYGAALTLLASLEINLQVLEGAA
jgi:hypothetical protein